LPDDCKNNLLGLSLSQREAQIHIINKYRIQNRIIR
jgi:hypothetical protein